MLAEPECAGLGYFNTHSLSFLRQLRHACGKTAHLNASAKSLLMMFFSSGNRLSDSLIQAPNRPNSKRKIRGCSCLISVL